MKNIKTTVIDMLFGSHIYGTNTETSDTDYKYVSIPPARNILLQKALKADHKQSKEDQTAKNTSDDFDYEDFSLHHYMKLLCEGQTVAIDMLFVPEKHWNIKTDVWQFIVDNRAKFISSKTEAFIGYCRKQANKYGIKGSRMAEAKAIVDLLESLPIYDRLEAHMDKLNDLITPEHTVWENILNKGNGVTIRHFSVCGRKVPLTIRVDKALETYKLLYDTYGLRARQAMNNEGVDWKATMHAVRIIQQAQELRATGEVIFPRPNAKELLEIRQGKWPFIRVSEYIENGIETLDKTPSILQPYPDYTLAEKIVIEAYKNQVMDHKLFMPL